jgi:hypothetical protein
VQTNGGVRRLAEKLLAHSRHLHSNLAISHSLPLRHFNFYCLEAVTHASLLKAKNSLGQAFFLVSI